MSGKVLDFLSRGMPILRLWPLAIVLAFVAVLLAVDPSGSDAAELFRYPLQINVYSAFAVAAATIVAYVLTAFLHHLGWHPRNGLLWVWLLVTSVPLLVTGVSFLLSLTGPLITLKAPGRGTPQDAEGLWDPILLLSGISAYWVMALGGLWLLWLIESLWTTVRDCRAANQRIFEILADPLNLVLDVNQPLDGLAAKQVALQLGSPSEERRRKEAYNLSLGGLQKLYHRCLELRQIDSKKAPKLVVVESSATMTGPGYLRTRRCGPMIVIPRDLSEFVQRTMTIARKLPRGTSDDEPNALDSGQKTLNSLAAILLHELGHHVSNEHRVDLLLNLNRAIFPLPWLVLRLLGVYRRLFEAREHVCDAEAVCTSGMDESFMRAAIQAMDEALKELRARRIASLQAQLRTLGVTQMTGGGSGEVACRLELLKIMPLQYHTGYALAPLVVMGLIAVLLGPEPVWQVVTAPPLQLPFQAGIPHRILSAADLQGARYYEQRAMNASDLQVEINGVPRVIQDWKDRQEDQRRRDMQKQMQDLQWKRIQDAQRAAPYGTGNQPYNPARGPFGRNYSVPSSQPHRPNTNFAPQPPYNPNQTFRR